MKQMRKYFIFALVISLIVAFTPSLWAEDAGKININKATVEQLTQLNGVGANYAERIVKYRTDQGPFNTPEDLTKVPGIGQKILEKNKDRITVE